MLNGASATSHEVAFGFATQTEFLCCEQLGQAIEEHQKDGHGHDNHIVADAAKGEKDVIGRENTGEEKHAIPLNGLNGQMKIPLSGAGVGVPSPISPAKYSCPLVSGSRTFKYSCPWTGSRTFHEYTNLPMLKSLT